MAGLQAITYPSYPFPTNQIFASKNNLPPSYPILPYLTQQRVTWVRTGKKKTPLQTSDNQALGNLGKIFHTFMTYQKNTMYGTKSPYAWKKKASDADILEKTDKFLKHLQHDEKK